MTDRTYVYAIHIATTPEKLWDALTQNEFWQQYWDGEWRIESDWVSGSAITYYTEDGKLFSRGEVVTSDAPRTLTYTWPNPPQEQGDDPFEELTWEIEDAGPGTVKLTLTHRNLTEGNYRGGRGGGPALRARVNSLLETGSPLKFNGK